MKRASKRAAVCAAIPRLAACGVAALTAACAPASDPGTGDPSSLESAWSESRLTADIAFLSDDALGGRGPATVGDTVTRLYIASRLRALGFEPLFGDGAWEQPFEILSVDSAVPERWTIRGPEGAETLRFRDEFVANGANQRPVSTLEDAPWVFVGYGIQAPEYGWDDFKEVDVRGKVLVFMNNDPDWDPELFQGPTRQYYGRWTYKYEIARALGAAGAVIIHTPPSAGYGWEVVRNSWTGPQFEVPRTDAEDPFAVSAWITEDAARRVWARAGRSLDDDVASARSASFAPIELGLRAPIVLRNDLARARTANVGGVLRGSDPALADTFVVYTAHHDHLGTGTPDADGDAVYNGALDNAAGVAQTLAVAGAFAALPEPPPRSIAILAVGAEEQGLLGSRFFAANLPFPAGSIVANLNIDGGNIWGATEDVAIVGMGKSSMDDVARRAAATQGREVVPEAFPDRGFFYRSDQFNFAKIGVPALYLDTGTRFVGRPDGWAKERIEAWEREHYHQPSDELDGSWSFEGMQQDVELMFLAGREVAESPELPTWNPGDEFEAARRQALDALD